MPIRPKGQAAPPKGRWVKHAITLILLAALAVTGTAAYFARQQWLDAVYMRLAQ